MLKNVLLILSVLFFCHSAYAINWVSVEADSGKIAYIDSDSIRIYNKYFFYNVKMRGVSGNMIVVTLQSGVRNPFSARLKVYKVNEYEALNGDYDNITALMTNKLEPVTFDSLVYACYKKAKQIYLIKKTNGALEF